MVKSLSGKSKMTTLTKTSKDDVVSIKLPKALIEHLDIKDGQKVWFTRLDKTIQIMIDEPIMCVPALTDKFLDSFSEVKE